MGGFIWAFFGDPSLPEEERPPSERSPPPLPSSHAPAACAQQQVVVLSHHDLTPLLLPGAAVPASLIPELSDSDNWQPAFGELAFDAPHFPVFENAVVRWLATPRTLALALGPLRAALCSRRPQ